MEIETMCGETSDRRARVLVLSGESGCGKTTLCRRVVALARRRGLQVAGILTTPHLDGGRRLRLDAEDIASGARVPLAERLPGPDGPATEHWSFYRDGLAFGQRSLRRAAWCDLLVIDELGPLELVRDEGWTAGLDLLAEGRYRLALVVIRPTLLLRFAERLRGPAPVLWTVTRANRDALPEQIFALLEERAA